MGEIIKPNPLTTHWQGPGSSPLSLDRMRQIIDEKDSHPLKKGGMVQYTDAFGRTLLVAKDFILEYSRSGELLRLELGPEVAFALLHESGLKNWLLIEEELRRTLGF